MNEMIYLTLTPGQYERLIEILGIAADDASIRTISDYNNISGLLEVIKAQVKEQQE